MKCLEVQYLSFQSLTKSLKTVSKLLFIES